MVEKRWSQSVIVCWIIDMSRLIKQVMIRKRTLCARYQADRVSRLTTPVCTLFVSTPFHLPEPNRTHGRERINSLFFSVRLTCITISPNLFRPLNLSFLCILTIHAFKLPRGTCSNKQNSTILTFGLHFLLI